LTQNRQHTRHPGVPDNMRVRLFYALAAILVLALGAAAAGRGWAEVLALGPRQSMQGWAKEGRIDDPAQLDRATHALARAARIKSSDADLRFDLAMLAVWKAAQYPVWSGAGSLYRGRAIADYRAAIERRPTWGLAWVALAQALVRDGQDNQAAVDALEKATVFAPWEREVQRRAVWLGAALWSELDQTQRDKILAEMRSVLGSSPDTVIRAAATYGLVAEVQPFVTDEGQRRALDRYAESLKTRP